MSIYDDFFNLEGPCPDTIKNCQELRNEYQFKVNRLTADGNCNGCQAMNLKAEFQTKIWQSYMQSLIISA